MSLPTLLAQLPGLYDDLLDSAMPVRTGEPADYSPDPRSKPTPGRLDVMEHRHKLLRGLRWWVDAVRDADGLQVPVGDSPARMCGYLRAMLDVMAAEDRAELFANLSAWRIRAWELADPTPLEKGDPLPRSMPAEAYDRVMPQKTAAQVLGVPVSTIWRRAGKRGGPVRLGDVSPRCGHCDLIVGQCEHTRAVNA